MGPFCAWTSGPRRFITVTRLGPSLRSATSLVLDRSTYLTDMLILIAAAARFFRRTSFEGSVVTLHADFMPSSTTVFIVDTTIQTDSLLNIHTVTVPITKDGWQL